MENNCSTNAVRKNKCRPLNVGGKILAHSAIKADGQMWTNSKVTRFSCSKEMTLQILYMQNRICLRRRMNFLS
jgi:hypothetical protein